MFGGAAFSAARAEARGRSPEARTNRQHVSAILQRKRSVMVEYSTRRLAAPIVFLRPGACQRITVLSALHEFPY
jgi:hypothetical protein